MNKSTDLRYQRLRTGLNQLTTADLHYLHHQLARNVSMLFDSYNYDPKQDAW